MPASKIGKNTTDILKLHFVTSNQISTDKKLYLPLASSIYFVFLPLEMQERLEQRPKYTTRFLTLSEKKRPQKPLKVAATKTLISNVYVIGTTCFDECVLFYVITGRHYFSWKINVNMRIFLNVMLMPSLKPVFWKKSVFYALSPK